MMHQFLQSFALTLNLTVVPGCCAAENPEPPNKELEPPKGLGVALVDPNSPPVLVFVPKPEEHEKKESSAPGHF